ncbi:TetR family transcriptional regulator [Enterococcus sp. JM4C]|uniref:TetR/AcrR family transcriptional regulator n=1 Tax=Candidatus Enterococcus huntleyi TaxID=1857217 RepID=UPI00137B674F|nr:TetR/AcrR family transcriptional regulator [Enterococcus sp. JM4C]KAF1299427.1 TetR family transcriptional regulator [Enterococcus sp. JM4C]
MARTKEFDEVAVLDKAVRIFWRKGYEKTSIQDLVDGMGIHRRSIYDTFGDKHALFLRSLTRYSSELEQSIATSVSADLSIKEKFTHLFSLVLSENTDVPRGCLIVNSATELALLDEEVAAIVQKQFDKTENFFYKLLVDAQANGELQTKQSLKDLAAYLHNAWVGLRVLAKTTNDQEKLQSIITVTLAVI